MKTFANLLCASLLLAGQALASGRLSSVSVSDDGTVMISTGSPNEFKSSWTGSAAGSKLIIDLPDVTVDKAAKVLGDLSANRGIKGVRLSQFKSEPPAARVVIETVDRLSYSWITKPEGVELRFMLPSPLPAAAGKTASGNSPSAAETAGPQGQVAASSSSVPNAGIRVGAASNGNHPAAAPATGEVNGSKDTGKPAGASSGLLPVRVTRPADKNTVAPTETTHKTAGLVVKAPAPANQAEANKPAPPTATKPAGAKAPAPTVTAEKPSGGAPGPTAPAPSAPVVKAPAVAGPVSSIKEEPMGPPTAETVSKTSPSDHQQKTGTATPAKNAASGSRTSVPTTGSTGVEVKPSSPAVEKPAITPTTTLASVANKGKAAVNTGAPKTSPAASAVAPGSAGKTSPAVAGAPAVKSSTEKSTAAPPSPAIKVAATGAPMAPVQPAKGVAASSTPTPTVKAAAASVSSQSTPADSAGNQKKFKEQLKKALGKIETPAAVPAAPAEDKKEGPAANASATNFQEQLKKALEPAKSLADTGEVANEEDIDADLPAVDEEGQEESLDSSMAGFPGGTFMQVSPNRKVIRYHSEGRRDPFSPLTGRDRFASGKKRRAVPAAEQLRLVGIMRSLSGNKALLEDGEGNGYILAPGDRVRNGYLVSVSENKVLFQVTEYGWTKTVAMELGTAD